MTPSSCNLEFNRRRAQGFAYSAGRKPAGSFDGKCRGVSGSVTRAKAVSRANQLANPVRITVKDRGVDATVFGCEPNWANVMIMQVDQGRFLVAQENIVQQNNGLYIPCVISAKLGELLFPYEDPIGKRIHLIRNSTPVVVGVLKSPASATANLRVWGMEHSVYIPQQYFATVFMDDDAKPRVLNHLAIRVGDVNEVATVTSSIESAIERFGMNNSTQVISTRSKLDELNSTRFRLRSLQIGLLAISSLLTSAAVVFATFAQGPLEAANISASRGSRLRALIIDGLISSTLGALIALALIYSPQLRFQLSEFLNPTGVILSGFVAYLLIHCYPIVHYGQSWGKRLCRIAVVNHKTGQKIGFLRYFMRELFKFLFGLPLFGFRFAFLSVVDSLFIFSKSRRCLHDWLAQTSVVKVSKPDAPSSSSNSTL